MTRHTFVIELVTEKPVKDLTDLIAGRVFAMDGVSKPADVTVSQLGPWLMDKINASGFEKLPVVS